MSHYNINTNNKKNVHPIINHIWLATFDGAVLIKASSKYKKGIGIENLTITTTDQESILKEIEKNWGIVCDKLFLRQIYKFKTKGTQFVTGYLLMVNFNIEYLDLVISKFDGELVAYQDLLCIKDSTNPVTTKAIKELVANLSQTIFSFNNN